MPLVAVIDACVIYDFGARDTLIRTASHGLFRIVWSRRILNEARRNLEENRPDEDFGHLFGKLSAIEEWLADNAEHLEAELAVHPDDRHVLAVAIAEEADYIVTTNLRHFPEDACQGVIPIGVNDFLLDLYCANPAEFLAVIREQSEQLRNVQTVADVVEKMERFAPDLARQIEHDGWLPEGD